MILHQGSCNCNNNARIEKETAYDSIGMNHIQKDHDPFCCHVCSSPFGKVFHLFGAPQTPGRDVFRLVIRFVLIRESDAIHVLKRGMILQLKKKN